MCKEYKIAFIPYAICEHLNTMIALAKTMRSMGHKCVFIVSNFKSMASTITGHGLDCRVYEALDLMNIQVNFLHQKEWMERSRSVDLRSSSTTYDRYTVSMDRGYESLRELIRAEMPDAFVVDRFVYTPAVVGAGKPWVKVHTGNPLKAFNTDHDLPPCYSGYSIDSDKTLWNKFRKERELSLNDMWLRKNVWLKEERVEQLTDKGCLTNNSPFLNLYSYPKELDYYESGPKDKTFVSYDSMTDYFVDNESKVFEIPEKLRQSSGKLIYISMGSVFCEKDIMKRFVSLLSNSKHRFIISKGHMGHEYDLPDNMWGQNWLPQLQVLPIVDLVLTHGGNNTFMECLYFGKPMIVLPLLVDQYDNAQRLVDKGLGVRLDAYDCTQTELFEAMDSLLNDSQLKAKYENISQRMKNSKSSQMCAKLIEDLITE